MFLCYNGAEDSFLDYALEYFIKLFHFLYMFGLLLSMVACFLVLGIPINCDIKVVAMEDFAMVMFVTTHWYLIYQYRYQQVDIDGIYQSS